MDAGETLKRKVLRSDKSEPFELHKHENEGYTYQNTLELGGDPKGTQISSYDNLRDGSRKNSTGRGEYIKVESQRTSGVTLNPLAYVKSGGAQASGISSVNDLTPSLSVSRSISKLSSNKNIS